MLSNRASAKPFRIAPSALTFTVTAMRPKVEQGFPGDTDHHGADATAVAFLQETGSRLFQEGAYAYLATATWRPREAPDATTFGPAMKAAFTRPLKPGDLLLVYEIGTAWVVTEAGIQEVPGGLADLAGYPQAKALGENPRSAKFLTTQPRDLIPILSQTFKDWNRVMEDRVRLQRPIRVTMQDFAKLVVTILYQDAEAAAKDETVLGLRQVLRNVTVEGLDDAY
jgi:hypothetical protein